MSATKETAPSGDSASIFRNRALSSNDSGISLSAGSMAGLQESFSYTNSKKLPIEDVKAIFECLHNRGPRPKHLHFKIVPVGQNGQKLSPPSCEFEVGLYVLLRPEKKPNKKRAYGEEEPPRAPPHLQDLVVQQHCGLPENCSWGLSGPQFPNPDDFQQRYCYPRTNSEYSAHTGSALWTVFKNGHEDHEYRILHVYHSTKRTVNTKGRSKPKMRKITNTTSTHVQRPESLPCVHATNSSPNSCGADTTGFASHRHNHCWSHNDPYHITQNEYYPFPQPMPQTNPSNYLPDPPLKKSRTAAPKRMNHSQSTKRDKVASSNKGGYDLFRQSHRDGAQQIQHSYSNIPKIVGSRASATLPLSPVHLGTSYLESHRDLETDTFDLDSVPFHLDPNDPFLLMNPSSDPLLSMKSSSDNNDVTPTFLPPVVSESKSDDGLEEKLHAFQNEVRSIILGSSDPQSMIEYMKNWVDEMAQVVQDLKHQNPSNDGSEFLAAGDYAIHKSTESDAAV